MTDETFQSLCNTYGFAPSRALRELLDTAVAPDEKLLQQALDALLYAADHTEPASLDCKCPICETIEALEERLREKI